MKSAADCSFMGMAFPIIEVAYRGLVGKGRHGAGRIARLARELPTLLWGLEDIKAHYMFHLIKPRGDTIVSLLGQSISAGLSYPFVELTREICDQSDGV
jgi:hypothetical protein